MVLIDHQPSCDLYNLFQNELLEFGYDSTEWTGIHWTVVVYAVAVVACFLVSIATGNYSQVDKLWSIVPAIYAWCLAVDERTCLMAVLATVWAVRLTWNFGRRGGYTWPPWDGEEDYRWSYLRKGFLLSCLTNPVAWQLFNIFFICLYQHFLLWFMVAPSSVAYSVAQHCEAAPLNSWDYVATSLFLLSIVVETIADNQQYAFQQEKYRRRGAKTPGMLTGEYADGFKQSGLFAIVRKPNYAAEQFVWIVYYLFSVAATNGKQLVNWSFLGCILLCALFQGSGWFTESITKQKYPKYAEYQKTTPLYVPSLQSLFRKTKAA